ncbi:MAG: hypothetical protein JW751_15510 [Polyangiaceae bacterium]|nr:hypothetical protein [Polyangiaceae bacterium]
MGSFCEVCAGARSASELEDARDIVKVAFDTRTVLLCRGHARIAENSGVKTLDGLRALYGNGRRS